MWKVEMLNFWEGVEICSADDATKSVWVRGWATVQKELMKMTHWLLLGLLIAWQIILNTDSIQHPLCCVVSEYNVDADWILERCAENVNTGYIQNIKSVGVESVKDQHWDLSTKLRFLSKVSRRSELAEKLR